MAATATSFTSATRHSNRGSLYMNMDDADTKKYSLFHRIFVIFRPGWLKEAKQHLNLQEFSGSLGDLGTFLPLVTALAVNRINGVPQISFGPVLFFAGVYSLLISTYFAIPIPIQPMKTITSAALMNGNSHSQITASGILMGVILLGLTLMGGIHICAKYIPLSLVRGIQMGIGLGLLSKGFSNKYAYVHRREFTIGSSIPKITKEVVWFGEDSVLVSVILGVFCLLLMHNKKVPIAIVVFVYGVIVAICRYYSFRDTYALDTLKIGPSWDTPMFPSWNDFSVALIDLVLPQLPLTILNSVVAVAALSEDLFPANRVSNSRVAASVGIGNLAFCWFGMLPSCHGAGGLASQYAFGARSNVSMIFLGIVKIFVALLFGSTSLTLLQDGIFPASVLGILLIFSGINLSLVALDVSSKQDSVVMLVTAAATLALDTGVAFLVGILVLVCYSFTQKETEHSSS